MSSNHSRSRAQFIVCLFTVLLAVGIGLSILTRVREEAAIARCLMNLKQIGVALYSYKDANEKLPPLVDQGEPAPTGRGLPSMTAILMPYYEATPITFHADRSSDYYHAHSSVSIAFHGKEGKVLHDGGMANTSVRGFICASDRTADKLRDVPMKLPDGTTGYYATSNYAANGLIPWGSDRKFMSSLGNTILFAERPQVCRTASGEQIYNLWGVGFYSPHMPAFATLTPVNPPGLWSTGQVAPILPLPDENSEDRDAKIRVRLGYANAEPSFSDFPTPLQSVRSGEPCDPRLPGTSHRQGMQVLMGDASVRVFGLKTSPWVFWNACGQAQPEIAPE